MSPPSLTRRQFLARTATGLMAYPFASLLGQTWAAGGAGKPNIIVCMVDDMGFSDPGCFGGEIDTPNLDRLARNGVRMNHFCSTSRCCPSRASILTGLHPQQTGMGYMTGNDGEKGYQGAMNNPHTSLARITSEQGYLTALSGKWHLNPRPDAEGFQVVENWLFGGQTDFFRPLDKRGEPADELDRSFYATDYYGDGVLNVIDKSAGKPFFVYWTPTAPHYPVQAKARDAEKYKARYAGKTASDLARARHERVKQLGLFPRDMPWSLPKWVDEPQEKWAGAPVRLDTDPLEPIVNYKGKGTPYQLLKDAEDIMPIYAAMVDCFDQNLGRVLAKLEATNQLDNTLILFCSDNGCSGEKQNIGVALSQVANTPFLKHKKSAYFGGTASPFIIHWPAKIKDGARGGINTSFGHVTDVLPTVLEACGGTYPANDAKGRPIPPMEGRSLLPILRGETVPMKAPHCMEHGGNCAVIIGEWKITSDGGEPWKLFNMRSDRFEQNNVAAQHPDTVKQLEAEWFRWADRTYALRHGGSTNQKADKKTKAANAIQE